VATFTYLFLDDIILQDTAAASAAGFPAKWKGVAADYGMDRRVVGQNGTDKYTGKYARSIKADLRSVPTLSLVMDLNDLFGTNGIYLNPERVGVLWARPVSVEIIYPDGPGRLPRKWRHPHPGRGFPGIGREQEEVVPAFVQTGIRCFTVALSVFRPAGR
jgi:hypothetical protein